MPRRLTIFKTFFSSHFSEKPPYVVDILSNSQTKLHSIHEQFKKSLKLRFSIRPQPLSTQQQFAFNIYFTGTLLLPSLPHSDNLLSEHILFVISTIPSFFFTRFKICSDPLKHKNPAIKSKQLFTFFDAHLCLTLIHEVFFPKGLKLFFF